MRKVLSGLFVAVLAIGPVIGCDGGADDSTLYREVEPNDTQAQANVMVNPNHDVEFAGACDANEAADFYSVVRTSSSGFAFEVAAYWSTDFDGTDLGLRIFAEDGSFDLTATASDLSNQSGHWGLGLGYPALIETNLFIQVMCLSSDANIVYDGVVATFG